MTSHWLPVSNRLSLLLPNTMIFPQLSCFCVWSWQGSPQFITVTKVMTVQSKIRTYSAPVSWRSRALLMQTHQSNLIAGICVHYTCSRTVFGCLLYCRFILEAWLIDSYFFHQATPLQIFQVQVITSSPYCKLQKKWHSLTATFLWRNLFYLIIYHVLFTTVNKSA